MRIRTLVLTTTLLSLCVGTACFKSSTTQGSSESSSDSSRSSSGSSSPEKEKQTAYRQDVRDYTATFAASRGDVQAFQRDLSEIAAGHGISDWEQQDATFLSIGEGIALSGVDDRRYRELAAALSNESYPHLELVRAGYETQRRP